MNGLRRLRQLVVPARDGFGLARVVVAVRVAVVVSIAVLTATGPTWMHAHWPLLALVLVAALGYAGLLMWLPRFEVRRTPYAVAVSALDVTFTLALIALTGGAASPVVTVLVLVVLASAARLRFAETIVLAIVSGVGYLIVVMNVEGDRQTILSPFAQGAWWALYLVFTAVLSGGLSTLLEREHHFRLRALVEAEAEHAAAEEERDLRARLLRSYEAQREGLQVLLHEFRTPVASLDALTETTPASESDRDAALRLAGRHARHLSDMLDALSDVNLSRQPAFSSGRVRRIDVAELVAEAADAAGVRASRLRLTTTGQLSAIQVDAQGLRRVLTNLVENAARHGRGLPIDVTAECQDGVLRICIADRGPGVPLESMGELTAKFVSLSDRRGTAGLGLWIVAQIVDALGGTLQFCARDGGGLAATFTVPVA